MTQPVTGDKLREWVEGAKEESSPWATRELLLATASTLDAQAAELARYESADCATADRIATQADMVVHELGTPITEEELRTWEAAFRGLAADLAACKEPVGEEVVEDVCDAINDAYPGDAFEQGYKADLRAAWRHQAEKLADAEAMAVLELPMLQALLSSERGDATYCGPGPTERIAALEAAIAAAQEGEADTQEGDPDAG